MRFRWLQRVLLVLGAPCLLGGVAIHAADAPQASRPNILLIVADDLGYGDLGVHGGKEIPTPHIDSIAAQGVRCSSGYVSGPYCSPTRAGLLTGRYQQRFGHEFNPGGAPAQSFGLNLKEVTLPAVLKDAGYVASIVGKWHLGNAPQFHPLQRGFDHFFGFLGGAHPYVPGPTPANPILRGTKVVDEKEYLTTAFEREALAFLDSHKAAAKENAKPFFLYLPFNAVHTPMQATPESLAGFDKITDERRRNYAGMLTAMDQAIGKVLARLKEHQIEDNTLVVFISDNGGPPANGSLNTPLSGQKATTWEGGIRVPFFVKWPGHLPAGVVYEKPVIQLDLFPTFLAAAGAAVPTKAPLDGVNLLPYFSGTEKNDPHERLYWRFGEQRALRQGDWKLLKARGDAQAQLFNLATDISESKNLAAVEPEKLKELQAAWDEWNSTLVEPSWKPNAQQPGGKKKGGKKKASVQN